jgi:hypothetical protein
VKRTHRAAAATLVVAGFLATPLSPVQAYDGQSGNDGPGPARLAAVRNATSDYRDFAKSQADGFTTLVTNQQTQATCISNGSAGAMGQHYANAGRVGDGLIEQQRPEVLLYEPQSDGSKRLVGVEYVVIASDWLAHHDAPPSLFGTQFDLITSNPFGLPPFYALHAWAWQDNPTGAFKAWNPTVTCP